ncbi:MAG: MBL fold metallo-hydrolase [Bacillota bacterium]|nr:MBL fold metallo-hydrolase [Bacillota bacterium]
MKLEFYGAASCVTGSCHILKVNGKNVLLDCGMYQGKDEDERGNEGFTFNPKEIDYVILSHAHIDHSGRIPLLYKKGFKGQVICTEGTKDLCSVMLPDSGHIQEKDVEWKNRRRLRQGLEPIEPLYTAKMAELSMYLFVGYPYDQEIDLFDGFRLKFRDAGHLLGSSIIEMFVKEADKDEIKLVYTGDLGNTHIPLIKDPTPVDAADIVIMETTYGDRLHEKGPAIMDDLVTIIKDTFAKGGNVIIPSFAVGRAQEVLYALNRDVESHKLKDIRVFVDSPLASQSTKIFEKYIDYYDEDAKKIIEDGDDPIEFPGLEFTQSPEDSAALNKIEKNAIIISASGMCEAGRIRHHLKHNLWRKECSIVFVGYQAEGTLGRAILNGAKKVKLFGEEIAVNAKIYNLPGLSGHADRNGLNNWLMNMKKKPKEVLLVHGDEKSQVSFKELIESEGFNARIMHLGDKFDSDKGIVLSTKAPKTSKKEKIMDLLSSMGEIENLDTEVLLEKIKEAIK